jgi:hypothetical protein
MISAGGCIYFSYLGVTVMTEKKPQQPETERFKQILIEAFTKNMFLGVIKIVNSSYFASRLDLSAFSSSYTRCQFH